MKRLTLLIVLLVALGVASGFALEVKPGFTLSGSATLTWGVDLDNSTTGFYNEASGDLVVTLLAKDGTDTHAGTEGFFGSITISNVELYWTDTAVTGGIVAGDISAKIVGMGGKLALGIYDAPDLALDFVGAIENSDVDDTVVDIETGDIGVDYGQYGTYASYTVSDNVTASVEVVSADKWTLNTANAYAFAFDLLAKFAPLTINAGVNKGFNYASNPMGFGVKVAADTAAVDGYVSFDGSFDTAFAYEVGAGATLTFLETVTAAVSVVYGDAFDKLDAKFVFTEPAAKGLVDNLDLTFTAYLLDLLGVAGQEMEFIVDGGYLMGTLYPNFTVTYGDANNAAPFLTAKVGVDATMIPLTTLGLYWTSGDLMAATPVKGTILASAKVKY